MYRRHLFIVSVVVLAGVAGCGRSTEKNDVRAPKEKIKIAYLVKQPEEPWFQSEWHFAKSMGDRVDAEVVEEAVPDEKSVLTTLESLAAQHVQGVIICPPDTHTGNEVKAKADSLGLKLMTVDDRFFDGEGKPLAGVPHVGADAAATGAAVGTVLGEEWKKRGWPAEETCALIITFDQLPTARDRTVAIRAALVGQGFPESHIFTVPQRASDMPAAFDATSEFFMSHPNEKHWLLGGFNDNTVLGGVRALEAKGVDSNHLLAVGINGTEAVAELERPNSGFIGSILMSPKSSAGEAVTMMCQWVTTGKMPAENTLTKEGVLMNRGNHVQVLKREGLDGLLKR